MAPLCDNSIGKKKKTQGKSTHFDWKKLHRLSSGRLAPLGITHLCPPLRFHNQVPTFAVRETASLGQQMLERWEKMG